MRRLAELGALLLMLAAWEGLVRLHLLPGHLYATPTGAIGHAMEMAAAGELTAALKASLVRAAGGLVLGAVPGMLAGLVLGLVPLIRDRLRPTLEPWTPAIRTAVPLLLLPLMLSDLPAVTVVAAGAFALAMAETLAGVTDIRRRYYEVARSFGANHWHFCLTIALPGALPRIFTGLKWSAGLALLLTAVAEAARMPSGVGYVVQTGYAALDINRMFVGLALTALLGLLFAGVLTLLERTVVPWRP